MTAAGYSTQVLVMPSGEKNKTTTTYLQLLDAMLQAGLERKSPVIALGGGITGDVAGFVAATYLRGVPFIQCPTTLLAMVDASVGGKVGVNTRHGKNLVGAFHQPHAVIVDPETLRTLPDREIRCGLAECVKHAMIRDKSLLDWIDQSLPSITSLESGTMTQLIEKNVQIKANVVMEDEKESGVRAHLNFGHTFAHAIEASNKSSKLLHGEAVSVGMVAATTLACEIGRCRTDVLEKLVSVLTRIGLPTSHPKIDANEILLHYMRNDKKVADGKIRLVLPESIGKVFITDEVDESKIAAAWDAVRR